MNSKSENASRQQYRQLIATNISHNYHRYIRDMQNIAIMRSLKCIQRLLKKALISSSDSKKKLVEAGSLPKSCEILPVSSRLSCGSKASDETRIGLRTGLKRTLNQDRAAGLHCSSGGAVAWTDRLGLGWVGSARLGRLSSAQTGSGRLQICPDNGSDQTQIETGLITTPFLVRASLSANLIRLRSRATLWLTTVGHNCFRCGCGGDSDSEVIVMKRRQWRVMTMVWRRRWSVMRKIWQRTSQFVDWRCGRAVNKGEEGV